MPTYHLRDVKRCLTRLGATFENHKGRPHANVKLGGRKARWPNPHDDPIDDYLLSRILKQLGISRDECFRAP